MKKIDVYIIQKMINFLDKYKKLRTRPQFETSPWGNFIGDNAKVIFTLKNKLKIFLYKDSLLSKLIYEDFEDLEEVFISSYLREGDVFFDIGANIGFHTVNAAAILKAKGKIYSFEPTPETFRRLQENIKLNNLDTVVKALQIGLSDVNTTLLLNVGDEGYDAFNSFADLKYVESHRKEEVSVYTAAEIVSQESITIEDIALIKIDVEGWELNVLKGMESLMNMKNFNPCFLIEFTEENVFRAGYSCRELYRYLADRGYQWFNYDAQLNKVIAAELKAFYPYENLIAIKDLAVLTSRLIK